HCVKTVSRRHNWMHSRRLEAQFDAGEAIAVTKELQAATAETGGASTTDAQTVVWLLNQPPNGLPNAMMTRWLTFIRLFDFEVKHVPGAKNSGPDGLSRRGKAPTDEEEEDPDDFFDAMIYFVTAENRNVGD